jgi:hypothetical protein
VIVGGDTGQSLDGQVRQPARKRWPILAAMAVLGLLALALLLLKPQDAVAIKEGSADEPTTTTVASATTTTVAGASTTAVGATTLDPSKPGAPSPGATTPGAGGGGTTVAPLGPVPTGPKPTTLPSVPVPTTQTTQVAPCPASSSGLSATVPKNTAKVVVDTRDASDPSGGPLVVTGVTPPAHGTAVIDGTQRMITYTPASNFTGDDSFIYNINNGRADGTVQAKMGICVR